MTNRIEKTIELKAPVDRVWRALTDAPEFGRWFGVKFTTPFAVGETTRGHITYPGYEHLVMDVKVVRIEPKTAFAYEWHPYAVDPSVDYSGEIPTLVEFTLAPTPDGARLTVVETGFDTLPEHRKADALRMNDSGWAEQMLNIQKHVGG